jgi:hypothetical protein
MPSESDDDLLPGVPALDGGGEEGGPLPGLDEEDADPAGDELVGLDAEAGTGEDTDDDLGGDEAGSWTTDADDAGEIDDGEEDFGSEESGWTDDATTNVEDEEAFDDLEGASLVPDRGEEGVEECPAEEGADDALDGPLSNAFERDNRATDDDTNEFAFLEEAPSPWGDDSAESRSLTSFGLAPGVSLDVDHLGPSVDAAMCVSSEAGRVLAGGTHGLYQSCDDRLLVLWADEGESEGVTTVVCDRSDRNRIAIGTRLAGVRISRDGGITFDSANGWNRLARDVEVALFVAGEPTADRVRLWARTRSGALFRSDDFGSTWSSPVLLTGVRAFAVDPEGGGVAAVVASRGAVHIARSHDGGAAWSMQAASMVPGLALAGSGELALATLGHVVVLAHPDDPAGVHISHDGGATWTSDTSLRGACALALVREENDVVLYAGLFAPGEDRGVVVRCGPEDVSSLILDVAAERRVRSLDALGDPDGDPRIFAIEARAAAGTTHIFVATGAGLFRVVRSHTAS